MRLYALLWRFPTVLESRSKRREKELNARPQQIAVLDREPLIAHPPQNRHNRHSISEQTPSGRLRPTPARQGAIDPPGGDVAHAVYRMLTRSRPSPPTRVPLRPPHLEVVPGA